MQYRELQEVGAKLEALCREGDLQEPDVVIDNHDGSFTALWFEPELAVIIEPDERAVECTGEPEVPSSDDPDPRRRPEFFQAVALIADLCERGGLPKFDHVTSARTASSSSSAGRERSSRPAGTSTSCWRAPSGRTPVRRGWCS